MKKSILLITLFATTITSCSFPNQSYSLNTTPVLYFGKGKWLLNKIDSPEDIRDDLFKITNKEFKKYLKDDFISLENARGVILPINIPLNPNKTILEDIKNGSGYDYFVNIKAEILREDFGNITFSPSPVDYKKNSAKATLEVYDLNNLEIIYNQTVIGATKIDGNSSGDDFILTVGTSNLMVGSLRRIIKMIRKNHVIERD